MLSDQDRKRFGDKWTCSATGCFEWQASTCRDGYGRFSIGGKKKQAHRVAYAIENGPIPGGLVVRHVACSNPSCVRASHLAAGDQAANIADRACDSNDPVGERNGRAKLSERQVREMRRRYAEEERARHRSLGADYGLDRKTVRQILRRELWAHVREH